MKLRQGSRGKKRALALAPSSFCPWGAAARLVGDFYKEVSAECGAELLTLLFTLDLVQLCALVSLSVIKQGVGDLSRVLYVFNPK